MATYGHQIAGQPASWSGRCEDEEDRVPSIAFLPKAALRAVEAPSLGAVCQLATPCASPAGQRPVTPE
jgi:hypothetical protein